MFRNQLHVLEQKEAALTAVCGAVKTQISAQDIQEKTEGIKKQFHQLNAVLSGIQDSSAELQAQLSDLDKERKSLLAMRDNVAHIQHFKAALIEAKGLIDEAQSQQAIDCFEFDNMPDMQLVDLAPPHIDEPSQMIFEDIQQSLVAYLHTIVPETIPEMIEQLRQYIRIFKLSLGTSVFIKHIQRCLLYTSPSPRD